MNTHVIRLTLRMKELTYIPLNDGLRIQILPSIFDLPRAHKHHYAAFIEDPAILVVWDDDPQSIMARAETFERQLVEMLWRGDHKAVEDALSPVKYPKEASVQVRELSDDQMSQDLEQGPEHEPRPWMLIHAMIVGFTLAVVITTLGLGWRKLTVETILDHKFIRYALLLVAAPTIFVSLFFFQVIIQCVFEIIGPVDQLRRNTRHYSGAAPRRLNRDKCRLPHVTIQMPVYREGLVGVIQPTIMSLKAAISTYEMQGGSANIFVNDDGLQTISAIDAQRRKDFYLNQAVGWVARPPHDPEGTGFIRRGKFKKASNMNYAFMIGNKIEDKLEAISRDAAWTQDEEEEAYEQALAEVLKGEEGRAWADGNIRVGDYILLIDSDTRVPADCLLDSVSELEACPDVGILQHSSGVMQVAHNFFENGVTFFTNLIYTAIRYGVANGDVAPFVGHNAFLRWSAMQEVAMEEEGVVKIWSESHVSEDFDMALRMQIAGYISRLAAYAEDGFKEGVSLTVYDELARWEKYAYGCNELVFHPVRYWPTRGLFTPLFKRFIGSNMKLPSKLTIISYIGTYYGIGVSWILVTMNFFVFGWDRGTGETLDNYYLDSFRIYFSLVLVFTGIANVALAVLRYRSNEKALLPSLLENFKWAVFLALFLGGLSLHVSQALVWHMFGIDIQWGATAKEVEDVTFFEEIPRVFNRFRWMFLWCIISIGAMVAMRFFVPAQWQIDDFSTYWPFGVVVVSHALVPIALNPNLMLFTF